MESYPAQAVLLQHLGEGLRNVVRLYYLPYLVDTYVTLVILAVALTA